MVNVYTTALRLGRPRPSWVPNTFDQDRVTAYQTYWDMYRNIEDTFVLVMRDDTGDEISRRYVPSARKLIEATNSYLGKGLRFDPVPDRGQATDVDQVMALLNATLEREKFLAKFASLKRWMLVRGDAVLHVTADPLKPATRRVSITEISPESYFPIFDSVEPSRVVGCYLVQPMVSDDEDIVSRLMYRKITNEEDSAKYGFPIGSIVMQLTFWEPEGWDDRETDEDLAQVDVPVEYRTEAMAPLLEGTILPAEITAIPVYHFRNNYAGSEPYGVSELQGLETLITGVNQTLTDEELALVLQGIGVYWTDSGAPRDEDGEETDWVIAPAAVMELEKDAKFGRVQGVTSVTPFRDHSNAMSDEMMESSGTPAVAIGRIDTQTAESGIALEIQFRPITAKNSEKETELLGVLNQMVFDLVTGWFPAYEQVSPGSPDNPVVVQASFESPLPINREKFLKEIIDMLTAKIVSIAWAQQEISRKLGYNFPASMLADLMAENQQLLDPTGGRIDEEAGDGSDPTADL